MPSLIGWIRPVVLLPTSALAGLTPEQLDAVLAHELAHLRRHDYVINLLQAVIETLLFYHPAVWWVSKRTRDERELCCDELAIEACGDPVVYVGALAALEELRAPGSSALALAATDGDLLRRTRRLLRLPVRETNTAAWLGSCAAIVAIAFALLGAQAADQAPGTPVAGPDVTLPVAVPSPTPAPVAIEADPGPVLAVPVPARPAQEPVPVLVRARATTDVSVAAQPRQAETTADEVAIRRLEEEFRRAKVEHDLPALDRLWDDAFVETNQTATRGTRRRV